MIHTQPLTSGVRGCVAGVNQHLTSWILDYLTNRPQYVRTQDYVSDTIICSMAARREQSWPLSCSPSALQTSPTNPLTAIHKTSLTTLLSSASSGTTATYKKGQNRVHLLRKLRSFGVQGDLLTSFYDSGVASAIFYGVVCWRSSNSAEARRRLDKLIKKARFILGSQVVGESRMMDKLSSLQNHTVVFNQQTPARTSHHSSVCVLSEMRQIC